MIIPSGVIVIGIEIVTGIEIETGSETGNGNGTVAVKGNVVTPVDLTMKKNATKSHDEKAWRLCSP